MSELTDDHHGCDLCIFEIRENRKLMLQQVTGMEKLAQILDRRVGDLIDILRERQHNPYQTFNRVLLLIGGIGVAGFIFLFLHEFGIDTVKSLADVWKGI